VLALGFVLASVSCGSDDGTGPPVEELAGNWLATRAEVVSVADPGNKVDLVTLGGSFTLTLSASGTFSGSSAAPGEPAENWTGTWTSGGDVLTMSFQSGLVGTWQFDMTLSGDVLTLTGADAEFDMDGDDTPDPVKLNLVLARQ
jgi:hypothetical protein